MVSENGVRGVFTRDPVLAHRVDEDGAWRVSFSGHFTKDLLVVGSPDLREDGKIDLRG